MKLVNTLKLSVASLAFVCGLAQAAPALQLSSGSNEVTIFDNLSGDADATAGIVKWAGLVGDWTIYLSIGFGHDYLGLDAIHLTNMELTTTSPTADLTIKLTDTNLMAPSSGVIHWGADVGASGMSAISYGLYVDDSNTAFKTAGAGVTLIGDNSTASPCPAKPAYCFGGDALVSDLYSVTFLTAISHRNALGFPQVSSIDFAAQVPEPGVLSMLALGLLGFGATTRRRRRNK
ncbi:MAG TPA: PEP-CTERM sorting domain-containing protein [Burkholderiaceae bacterium]|nr:PEP-CTERM sorting domain-containing protein [Burkholderiaceae bacterium]